MAIFLHAHFDFSISITPLDICHYLTHTRMDLSYAGVKIQGIDHSITVVNTVSIELPHDNKEGIVVTVSELVPEHSSLLYCESRDYASIFICLYFGTPNMSA